MGKQMRDDEPTAADLEAAVERTASQAAWALGNVVCALRKAGKPVPEWIEKACADLKVIEETAVAEWSRLTEAEKASVPRYDLDGLDFRIDGEHGGWLTVDEMAAAKSLAVGDKMRLPGRGHWLRRLA